MGKAPVLIKINSNKDRFLLLQSFPVCEVFSPVIFLKKRLKVPTLSKPKITDISLMAVRGMQQQPFRFGHHSFLYNLQRGRHTVGGK